MTMDLDFGGPNGHDGVWHISLANSFSKGSFELPIYSGASIKNYHIGFDLILALLHKITFIPTTDLYFRFLPLIISLSIGFLVYKLLSLLDWDQSQIFWSLFFVYFGGNFAIGFGGESTFWSQQAISTLINPPFALSLVFVLAGLIFVKNEKIILASVFLGLLIQIKAYASVVVLGALFLTAAINFYKKREVYLIKVFVLSCFISAAIFLPFNFGSGSLFEFKPFWFLETMMQFPDRVGWTKFGEAMINYKLASNLIKGIPAYVIAFAIFFYGNLGTRFLGELYIAKFKFEKKFPENIELIILFSILIGLIIPIFFVQRGTAWNTIQFFYYSLFLSSMLAGYVFSDIINSKQNIKYKKIFMVGIIIFTAHTSFKTLKDVYVTNRSPAKISGEELRALDFLKSQPDGVVLTLPFDREAANAAIDNPPRPLYLYESTAYVSAFSEKQVFLEDEVNLDITGVDWQKRREEIKNFFDKPDKQFLSENNIKYVYLSGERAQDFEKLGLKVIYDSDEVKILEYE